MASRREEGASVPLLVSDSRESYEFDELKHRNDAHFDSSSVSSTSTLLADIDLEDQQKDENDTFTRLPNIETTLSLPSKPRTSTSFLDGLRGLAALFVCLQHSNPCNQDLSKRGFGQDGSWEITSFPVLRLLFTGGDPAVPVFFVLSGYVLSKGPLASNFRGQWKATFRRLASAVLRRPFRLYISPLVISFMVVIIMQLPFGINPAMFLPPEPTLGEEISRWSDLSFKMFNPFQLQHTWITWFIYDIPVWTLPLELKGSMLIYALAGVDAIFSSRTYSRRALICLGLLILTYIILMETSYWAMGCFVAGMMLAYVEVYELDESISSRMSDLARRISKNVLFIVGLYLVCQPSNPGHPDYALKTPGWYYLALKIPSSYDKELTGRYWTSYGSMIIVASTLNLSYLRTFFSTRPLQYLGKISFMLYLVHLPILGSMEILPRMLGEVQMGAVASKWDNWLFIPDVGPPAMTLRYFVALLVLLPLCILVADITTRVLDTPSVNAGKWVTRKIGLDKETR